MQVKLLSLNLYEGGILLDNLRTFLLSEQPDIALFQEAMDGHEERFPANLRTVDEFRKLFPSYHFVFHPEIGDHRDEGIVPSGNLTMSRFPILRSRQVFFDFPFNPDWQRKIFHGDYRPYPSSLQAVEIEIGPHVVTIINVHGIWGFDGEDNAQREKMGQIMNEIIRGKETIIVAGDFNLRPHTKVVQEIEKQLRNVFGNELSTTFNMKQKKDGGFAESVVDMMFLSEDIQVVNKYCPQVDVSDHLPLIATVEI